MEATEVKLQTLNKPVFIDDENLERLGKYFIHFNIMEKYNVSFEYFLDKWQRGAWIQ